MRKTLRPTEGNRAYYPGAQNELPTEGEEVEVDAWWLRRLREGVCEVVEAKSSASSAPPKKKSGSAAEGGEK